MRTTTTKRDVNNDSRTVSFRLGGGVLAMLEARASENLVSRGELARAMVLSVLQDENNLQLMEDVRRLQADLQDLRADIATTLEVMLINLAAKEPDAVREFVRAHLRHRA